MSKQALSRYQVSILLRDLNFNPTPLKNKIKLKSDIQSFVDKLRLIECFHNSDDKENSQRDEKHESLVRETGKFFTHRNRDKDLDLDP